MALKLLAIFAVLATFSEEGSAQSKRHFCGRELTTAMYVLCDPTLKQTKKSYPNSVFDLENNYRWAWLWHRLGQGDVRGKRMMGGIVEECCDNPCTEAQLLNYCPE